MTDMETIEKFAIELLEKEGGMETLNLALTPKSA